VGENEFIKKSHPEFRDDSFLKNNVINTIYLQ
jgi:hypothetical protein